MSRIVLTCKALKGQLRATGTLNNCLFFIFWQVRNGGEEGGQQPEQRPAAQSRPHRQDPPVRRQQEGVRQRVATPGGPQPLHH
jgi:hypothetical protein